MQESEAASRKKFRGEGDLETWNQGNHEITQNKSLPLVVKVRAEGLCSEEL